MRKETDSLGTCCLDDASYYGIQTARAMDNFRISDDTFCRHRNIIDALVEVKKACARANEKAGALSEAFAGAIVFACDRLLAGGFYDQFPINTIRGCGTSINMNANEVIAHMANGNFVKALEAISLSEENKLFFDLFVSLMRLAWQRKIRDLKQWSEQVAGLSRERQKNFLDYCQRMTRENFIHNFHQPAMNYLTRPEENFATRFAPFVNERNVIGIMEELSEAQLHVGQNVNSKMVFFDFALKMIMLLKQ